MLTLTLTISQKLHPLPTHDHTPRTSENLSPANHKIGSNRKGEWIHSLNHANCKGKSHDANAGVYTAATTQTTNTIREQETSTVARSPLCSQKRHMATTALERSEGHKLPTIEISKRQQGEGEKYTSEPDSQKAQDVPLPLTPKPATESHSAMSSPQAKRSVSNKENLKPIATPLRHGSVYDVLEAAVVEAATPPTNTLPQSLAHTPTDDVMPYDEAIDQIDQTISAVPGSPVESMASETTEKPAAAANADSKPAPKSKKAPVVRTTKAAQARISLAHGPKDLPRPPAWGRPRESIGSLRQSVGPAQRNASGASAISVSDDEKKIAIPHSKPRPMSMSFPTPPPPPKSTKAPTRSTFALPGDAVAAKLKAAREEREKKEEQPKVFKARPIPAATKIAPAVRQTTTSRARESLGSGKDLLAQGPHLQQGHRRASSVASVRPAEQRQSISIRPSSREKSIATTVIKEVSAPRPSTSLANISKPRIASPADIVRAANAKARAPAKSVKGQEVFSRTTFANEAAEQDKRAKEEATRKARTEAAERSRQLSREWAEKRREKLVRKAEGTPA